MNHVVSLFAGAGGLSLGFTQAGIPPVLAAELNPMAASTYRANLGNSVVQADLATQAGEIVQQVLHRTGGQPILAVVGGPPCQGFSSAGSRAADDPRNGLVLSYLAIVETLRPSWTLFENVEGILTGDGPQAISHLGTCLARMGYTFRLDKVNMARWGLPQARKRVLVVGNRHGIPFTLPMATNGFTTARGQGGRGPQGTTVDQALAGLPAGVAGGMAGQVPYGTTAPASGYDEAMRSGMDVGLHATRSFTTDMARIHALGQGMSMQDLPQALWTPSFRRRRFRRVQDGTEPARRGGAPAGLRRLVADHASPTITSASTAELVHPTLDRPLTLRECARLQGFPDNYVFHGSFGAVATQVGNAFPPPVAAMLAKWLLEMHGQAGKGMGKASQVRPGLAGYTLTDGTGMSAALARTRDMLDSMP